MAPTSGAPELDTDSSVAVRLSAQIVSRIISSSPAFLSAAAATPLAVDCYVSLLVGWGTESFLTHGTLVRQVTCVQSLVNLQTGSTVE